MDKIKLAYIFLAPGADPAKNNAIVDTPSITTWIAAVSNYNQGVETAKEMVAKHGVTGIELCGGFGHRGNAMVRDAVKGKAEVGSVRFDFHPALDYKSGDDLFG